MSPPLSLSFLYVALSSFSKLVFALNFDLGAVDVIEPGHGLEVLPVLEQAKSSMGLLKGCHVPGIARDTGFQWPTRRYIEVVEMCSL
jgi:hypothetical protein